jgi:uncharacterized protein
MKALIEELTFIIEEDCIPKNVRTKVESAITTLQNEELECSMRVNKALQELDDLSEDTNIPSYLKPQIWNILSQLETL